MIRGLDHVALAVRHLEDRLQMWERMGLSRGAEHRIESEGVRAVFLPIGDTRLELIEPLAGDTPVGRFLDRRGEGMHHVCFRVDSVAETSRALAANGIRLVGGIRPGADGTPITFLHPGDTGGVLVELRESAAGQR